MSWVVFLLGGREGGEPCQSLSQQFDLCLANGVKEDSNNKGFYGGKVGV